MNNPFFYTPDSLCAEGYRQLISRIEILRESEKPEDIALLRELESGKMLGVLVGCDKDGALHTLYAFSGQIGEEGFHHPWFVEPVLDYLAPEGYFKRREQEISEQNRKISDFEVNELGHIRVRYEEKKDSLESVLAQKREQFKHSKRERAVARERGVSADEEAEMIRRSQFEKAELHRLKKRVALELEPFAAAVKEAAGALERMKQRRRSESEALQQWLFDNFLLLNGREESRSLSDIFAGTPFKIPPSGAGECCAPKLLQAAFLRGLKPISMAEYWYGRPKGGEVRRHGNHYPACRGKCFPVLHWMLEGVEVTPMLEKEYEEEVKQEPEIIFSNEWFCVVNKPSGLLSVPGKGARASLHEWLCQKYGEGSEVRMAHRLDQDTSGLIIATFGSHAYREMQKLFASRKVVKEYVALLDGDYRERGLPSLGKIELPLSPDLLDRPRQRVDFEGGKEALTEYRFTEVNDRESRVTFHPRTGRTHQLRVHAASEQGLGMPIGGDNLYGDRAASDLGRLALHARKIEFTFPIDGKHYSFEAPDPF